MPRPKGSRNKAQGSSKRDTIKAAAMKVFCHYGYDGATLELVAEASGTSRALVGKYFGTKQNLAVLCIREFISTFFATVGKTHEKGPRYYECTEGVANLFMLHRDEWRFIIAVLCTPSLADLHAEIIPHYLGVANGLVGNRAGDLQNPAEVPELAWLMTAAHFAYVIGGSVPNCNAGRRNLLAHYLKSGEIL